MRAGEERAAEAAQRFRERHSLGIAPLGDLQKLVESLNIDLILRDLPTGVEAFTAWDPQTNKVFVAAATTRNAERQRFTIAHELGHIEFDDFVEGASPHPPDHPNEDEAHSFARHLLIPVDAVDAVMDELGAERGRPDLSHLSAMVQRFGVSPHVATIQLTDQGWATSDQEGWKDLHAGDLAARFGWERERAALVAASEEARPSQRLAARAISLYGAGLIGEDAVASVVGATASEIGPLLRRAGVERPATPKTANHADHPATLAEDL